MFEIPETDVVVMADWDTNSEPANRLIVRLRGSPPRPDLFYASPVPYGFGDRPDTALAVAALRALDLDGRSFADVGSGTGLVAIIAAKMGATVSLFEENDACRAYCLENCRANGVSVSGRARFPDDLRTEERYDIAVANVGNKIPADVIGALRGQVAAPYVVRWHVKDLQADDFASRFEVRWEALGDG